MGRQAGAVSPRFEDNMTNKHLWIRRVSSLLFLAGVAIADCDRGAADGHAERASLLA